MNRGIISKMFDWIWHPTYSEDQSPTDWFMGLVVILCFSFAWTRVLKKIVE